MPIAKGTQIGPYQIVGWLGAGGMGEVYRARDERLSRDVAIKLIPETVSTDPNRLRRFEQEARAAGQLNHPNILSVYDIGVHAGVPYIVSELLEGESLRSVLHRGPLTPRKAVDYARQTADGLAAAHDKHIVHRDVKPDNLFVTDDGRIKILDFGIAKLTRPSDEATAHTSGPTETDAGTVVGTAGYMSPEQVRGEAVDARSDLFSVGTVLYEMLTGRPAFSRETNAETMTAILKEDPAHSFPTEVPPALVRIVSRCLEKTRETRFQSARDLAFGLEVLSETQISAVQPAVVAESLRWRGALGVAVVVLSLLTAAAVWLTRGTSSGPAENPLANARFTPLTDWPGTEEDSAISPDGRFVVFLADRAGEFDLWLSQLGTGDFRNITADIDPLEASVAFIFRKFGFSGDGAEVWFSRGAGPSMAQLRLPIIGGTPRAFLTKGATAPSWSPDGNRLVYFVNSVGDPMFIADRNGANARQILPPLEGTHTHNPVWSPDSEWIYFVRGVETTDVMDVWRVRPSGESPEQLTQQKVGANFLAPLDSRTLLYVARDEDRSGPWLWSLDVPSKVTRRVSSGLEHYTSASASSDGRRVVATIANPTSSLWTVPIRDRLIDTRDAQPFPVPTTRALGPRFGGKSLFYLSSRGGSDGLWRAEGGQASEISRGVDAPLSEPPAVSPDGNRAIVVFRKQGRRQLAIVSADGRTSRTLEMSIDIQGSVGQGIADWSPDGGTIVVGGSDAEGPGLFKVPVDGGDPVRIAKGQAGNPVWSPDGNLIVYSGPFFTGQVPLLGVRPDGTPVELPLVRARPGAYRFLRDGSGLAYLPFLQSQDFSLLDFATHTTRQLTRLSNRGKLQTFDITPDGKNIVFDRSQENSNIVLIELPPK
ncbi:MAG: LpqB family beta-propeller domain-containing protein [Vicinamibacterales bacterium]